MVMKSQQSQTSQSEEDDDNEFFQQMFEGTVKNQSYLFQKDEASEKSEKLIAAQKKIGTFVGTPIYQSPEMIRDNISGPYMDIWALGVIIYQMIVGEVPWNKGGLQQRQKQILNGQINYPDFVKPYEKDLI